MRLRPESRVMRTRIGFGIFKKADLVTFDNDDLFPPVAGNIRHIEAIGPGFDVNHEPAGHGLKETYVPAFMPLLGRCQLHLRTGPMNRHDLLDST